MMPSLELIQENVGDDMYEFYPLGKHIVRAKGVCGGRPTFKYTRIEVSLILARIASGKTMSYLVEAYDNPHLTHEAIQEAIQLANHVFTTSPLATEPVVV